MSGTADSAEAGSQKAKAEESTSPSASGGEASTGQQQQDPKNVEELTSYIQQMLQQMQDRFQTMSDQIITRMDDMVARTDCLENNITDLMIQAGQAEQQQASQAPETK